MFGKKKEGALVSHLDDSRSIARDFRRRAPFESYRCMEYRIYPKLQEKTMYPMLDKSMEELLPGADEGNLNMLNNKLLAIGMQSLVDLERQRIAHLDTIHRLAARRRVDRFDLVQMLEQETAQLEVLLEEHKTTRSLLEACEKGEKSQ